MANSALKVLRGGTTWRYYVEILRGDTYLWDVIIGDMYRRIKDND